MVLPVSFKIGKKGFVSMPTREEKSEYLLYATVSIECWPLTSNNKCLTPTVRLKPF